MTTLTGSEWVEPALHGLNDDDYFQRIASHFDATILFAFGEDRYLVTLSDGTVTDVEPAPAFAGWDFAVRAPMDTWEKHFAEVPPPKYNDLRSLWLQCKFDIEGDVVRAIQHWRPLKYLIEAVGEEAR